MQDRDPLGQQSSLDHSPPSIPDLDSSQLHQSQSAELLLSLATRLGSAVTTGQVTDAVIEAALPLFSAAVGLVAILSDDNRMLECVSIVGVPESEAEPWRQIDIETKIPLADAVRERRLVSLTMDSHNNVYPELVDLRASAPTGLLVAVPLLIGDRCIGGIGLICPAENFSSAAQHNFLWTIANQCALALDRARLYEAERQARFDAVSQVEAGKSVQATLHASETRFRQMADAIPHIAWTTGPDGSVDYYNQRWYTFSGLTLEETRDWGWQPLIHPDDMDNAVSVWRAALAQQTVSDVEYRLRRADGIYRWHLGRSVPVFDEDGVVNKWVGTATDIEDRMQTEDALRASEQKLRLAIEGADLGTWHFDLIRRTMDWSDRAKELYGLDSETEMSDDTMMRILHEGDRERIKFALNAAIAGDADYDQEYRVVWPDGSVHWIASRGRAHRNANGTALQIEGVCQDITARRLAEDNLRVELDRTQAMSRRNSMLNQIAQAVLRSSDADEIHSIAVNSLGEALQVDRCYFHFFDTAQDATWIETEWRRRDELPPIAGRYPLSPLKPMLLDDLFRHGASVRINDIHSSFLTAGTVQVLQQGQYRAVLTTPFYDEGELTALLALVMTDALRVWTDEDAATVEAVAAQTRAAVDAARIRRREHAVAEQLARALQPDTPALAPGLKLAEYYRPAMEDQGVGGDFSSVFSTAEGATYLVVGDLSGKGLAAASQVATVRHMLQFAVLNGDSLADQVTALNRTLSNHGILSGFATLFVGKFDAGTKRLTYVNCGQDPALIMRADPGGVEALNSSGPVLGMDVDSVFTERTVQLNANDAIAIYTDGLTEAGPTRLTLLSAEGVAAIAASCAGLSDAQTIVQQIVAGVDAHAGRGVRDDQCLLAAIVI